MEYCLIENKYIAFIVNKYYYNVILFYKQPQNNKSPLTFNDYYNKLSSTIGRI